MGNDKMAEWLLVCNRSELDASRLLAAATIAGLPSRVALAEVALGCWRFARALGPRPDALRAFARGVISVCSDACRVGRRCEKCDRVRDTMEDAAKAAEEVREPYLFAEADVKGLR